MNYSVLVVPPQAPITWQNMPQTSPPVTPSVQSSLSCGLSSENDSEQKNQSLFGCNFCSGYFSRDSYLREHITRCQFQNSDVPSTFCGVCKQLFYGVEMLQKHLQTHFRGGSSFAAASIPVFESNTVPVKAPVRAARQIVSKAKLSNTNQSYECKFCGRTFQKGSAMKMHIDKVHMTDVKKEFKCRFCNQQYTTRHLLQNHEASHEGKWKHMCLICGKGFNSSGALVIHERIHTSNKPYKCNECDKRFVASNELRKHQRIHTGERPYKCTQCNSTFTQAANLRRHQLKNCRGRPSLKTIMKNLNKKNSNRVTKVEEAFDVPEPVTILPLTEPEVVPSKKSPETQVRKIVNIQPSNTLTQINTDLDDFTSDLSQEELIEGLGDDSSFNAFGESKPALGLEGMDTKPIQLLGLDDLEPHFGNDAFHLTCDENNDHQVATEVPLDGTFDLGTFSPFKKSSANVTLENGHSDILTNGKDDTTLLNYLKFEIPFLSQNGFNTNMAAVQNGLFPAPDEKISDKEDLLVKSPKTLESHSEGLKLGVPNVTSSPIKFKYRSNLLHRGKPIQQRRHALLNPVKKNIKKAVKMSIKKSPRRLIRPIKREPLDWQADDNYEVLLDSLDIAKHTVNGQDVYPCTNCDRTFTELGHIKLHMIKTHQIQETKKFACKYCNKQYSDRSTLKGHENQHNGDNKFTCKICHKVFNLKAGLVIHERVHSGHRPFSCESCDKTFRSSNELARHRRTHTGARPYKCHYCTMTFTQSANLRRHIHKSCKVKRGNMIIDVQPLHSCATCGTSFNDKSKLEQHATTCRDTSTPESVSSQNSHQTAEEVTEGQATSMLNSATPHASSNPSEQPKHHVSELDKTLGARNADVVNIIPDHLIKTEKDQTTEKNIKESTTKESKGQDDFEISMKNKLNALTNSIKNKKVENKQQHTTNGYIAEKSKVHINGYTVDTSKKLDFLSTDDSTIGYESDMGAPGQIVVEHKETAANSKDVRVKDLKTENANVKPNGFTVGHPMLTLTSLLTGNSWLTGNGMATGDTFLTGSEAKLGSYQMNNDVAVGKAFPGSHPIVAQWDSLRERSRKYKLARKIKKKSSEPVDLGDNIRVEGVGEDQVHVCTKCDRKFKKLNHVKQHLIQHHKLHLGDKNYECNFCGKQYSDWMTLKGHEKQHMGEYYQCRLCSKPFYTKGTLKVHEKTHSSERPYQCKECDKSFKTSRDMNRHTRKHTGVKPYKCTNCGKMFTQSGNLKRHVTNNKCKLQQNETATTKLKTSPALKSPSNSGTRMRRKAYSPARRRKATPQKRQRKQRTPAKTISSTTFSSKNAVAVSSTNAAQTNNENAPSNPVAFYNSSTVKTESKDPVAGMDEISTNILPLSVKSDNVDIIREIIEKDEIIKAAGEIFRDFGTEENTNPALSVELNNEKNSSGNVKRNLHVTFNTEIKSEMSDKSEDRKFACSKCGVTVTSRTALTFHYNAKHLKNNNSAITADKPVEITDLASTGISALSCSYCTEAFRSPNLVQDHELKHHTVQQCSECSATFNGKIALDQHVVTQHLGGRRFKCESCSKSYVFKGSLKKHMKTCKNLHKKRLSAKKIEKPENILVDNGPLTLPAVEASANLSLPLSSIACNQIQTISTKRSPSKTTLTSVAKMTSSDVVTSLEDEITIGGLHKKEQGEPEVDRNHLVSLDRVNSDHDLETPSVQQDMFLRFFEEVSHCTHVLAYMKPVIYNSTTPAKPQESQHCQDSNFVMELSIRDSGSSQDIEDLDLATVVGLERTDDLDKRTLDGLGIDSENTHLKLVKYNAGRQCTGDGENQAEATNGEPGTEGARMSIAPVHQETTDVDAVGDSEVTDSDMEDPRTDDANQSVYKCRLCTQQFARPDKLALHVCWKHSPVVKLNRLTQVELDALNIDLEELTNDTAESRVTNSDEYEVKEDAIDMIQIASVTDGLSEDCTTMLETGVADTTTLAAIQSHNVKVIEPKELIQVPSAKGDIYVEKSNIPQLGKYEEHIEVLPRGDTDVKYKCKFCDKMFVGQGELSGQERIKRHVVAHLNRLMSKKSGPNILKRRPSNQQLPQQQAGPVVPASVAMIPSQPMALSAINVPQSSDIPAPKPVRKEEERKGSAFYMNYVEKNVNSNHTVQCKLCRKTYSENSRNAIKRHMQTVHALEEVPATVPNMWQCKFCSQMFPPASIQAMESHLMVQHSDKLDPSSPLLSKKQTMTSSVVQGPQTGQMASSVPQDTTATQPVQSNNNTDLSLYNTDTVKCKFCGDMFVRASLVDLQKHLLSQHGDLIDPNTMSQLGSAQPVVNPQIMSQSVPIYPETKVLNERVAAAVTQTVQEQSLLSPIGNVPQSHITLSVSNQGINVPTLPSPPNVQSAPFTAMDQNVTVMKEETAQSASNIDLKTFNSLISRLREYKPFVEVVSDKFGPGYKCRLCGKTYSSSALSPIRRHLLQFHAPAGHTYQGIQIPTSAKVDTHDAKGDTSNTVHNTPAHGNQETVASNPPVAEGQNTLLNQNWADYSKFISLDLNEDAQVLSCKFCSKAFTTDSCKLLIEHLQLSHLNQTPQMQTEPPPVQEAQPQISGTATFSDEFFQKCCKIVVIGNVEMLKCKYCGVVYEDDKLEKFREHIYKHYVDCNSMYPDEMLTPFSAIKNNLLQKLGEFENVEFARCTDVVEVDKTMMYKCKYCEAIFDTVQIDTVRAHLYSHFITTNGYPQEQDQGTALLAGGGDVILDQVTSATDVGSVPSVQPIEIIPEFH